MHLKESLRIPEEGPDQAKTENDVGGDRFPEVSVKQVDADVRIERAIDRLSLYSITL